MATLRPRVFVTRQCFPEAIDVLKNAAEVEVWPNEEPPTAAELQSRIESVDGVMTNIMDHMDAPTLQAALRLKVIGQLGVGVDNIDVAEATRRGVLVGNTPGVLAQATADTGFALLMSAARRIGESERWLREGSLEDTVSPHALAWSGRPRRYPGHSRYGPDRVGDGQAGAGI